MGLREVLWWIFMSSYFLLMIENAFVNAACLWKPYLLGRPQVNCCPFVQYCMSRLINITSLTPMVLGSVTGEWGDTASISWIIYEKKSMLEVLFESRTCAGLSEIKLTHWGRDKMATISQTTLFNRIFLNENVRIFIKFSLKFVPKGPIINIPALVQIMAWRRPGDKPLSETMMVTLLTHICITRPQWVKYNQFEDQKISILKEVSRNNFLYLITYGCALTKIMA